MRWRDSYGWSERALERGPADRSGTLGRHRELPVGGQEGTEHPRPLKTVFAHGRRGRQLVRARCPAASVLAPGRHPQDDHSQEEQPALALTIHLTFRHTPKIYAGGSRTVRGRDRRVAASPVRLRVATGFRLPTRRQRTRAPDVTRPSLEPSQGPEPRWHTGTSDLAAALNSLVQQPPGHPRVRELWMFVNLRPV